MAEFTDEKPHLTPLVIGLTRPPMMWGIPLNAFYIIVGFTLIAFLLGIQLFFKFVFGGGDDWLADIAGFATGFLLSFPLAPHGGERLAQAIAKVRRRR